MEPPEDSTLEDFQRWSLPHLKDYLAKCGISRKGKKAELAALAYSCHVMKTETTDTHSQNIEEAFKDYQTILHINKDTGIPDPLKISSGWIGENEGMELWPPTNIVDIIDHFRGQSVNSDELLSEYKTG